MTFEQTPRNNFSCANSLPNGHYDNSNAFWLADYNPWNDESSVWRKAGRVL